ncbi:adenylate/guanylate cyclase domain-containing protein [Croceiramulus getboli]|nr:adenylate/guanylate cyclase domain-containing protein [Flavobacteriaceae bacterium YJPT1-3]
MNSKISIWWEYTAILLFFVGGCNLFVYFKTAGLTDIFSNLDNRPFPPAEAHIKATLGGLLYGIKVIWFESRGLPWISGLLNRNYRRVIWVVGIPLLIFSTVIQIQLFYDIAIRGMSLKQAFDASLAFISSGIFLSFLVHCFFLSIALSFIRQLRIYFGETVFLNYLTGKYANPLVEERTFMFLDLNGSTSIAEKLGHVKYSRFLNKCFDDTLDALEGFHFEVYQFVGDEVVITWETQKDTSGTAIAMYRRVTEKLENNKEHYKRIFGIVPTFKAGVSCGKVSATMVGKSGRHIAYHGDVLNTTARLLGQCKKLGRSILFTDFYLNKISNQTNFNAEHLAELRLRGKKTKSQIYGIGAIT